MQLVWFSKFVMLAAEGLNTTVNGEKIDVLVIYWGFDHSITGDDSYMLV